MLINQKNYSFSFVLTPIIKEKIKIILFDFIMFIQVFLLFISCIFIAYPLKLLDKLFRTHFFMTIFNKTIIFIANL